MMTTRMMMMMMTIEAEASSATQQTARQLKVFPSAGDRRQNISQKSSQLENFSQNISQDFSQLVNFSTKNSQQVSQLENFLKNFFAGNFSQKIVNRKTFIDTYLSAPNIWKVMNFKHINKTKYNYMSYKQ